jgi:hypothetical protein
MRKSDHAFAAITAIATAVIGSNACAQGIKLLTTIDIPGAELTQFDIGVVDSEAGRYYLADRSNKGVDIFDTQTNKFVGRVEGFVGVVMRDGRAVGNMSGPNGVALDSKNKVLWVGDGDSTLKAIDLKAKEPKVIASINLGGQRRADELAVDETDEIVLVFNNADRPTFGSFVSTKPGYKILGKIELPDASDGVEQSIYVRDTGLFYSSVPVWKDDNNKGGLAIFDPKTMKMVELVSIPGCQPTGLIQGQSTHLLVGCAAGAASTKLPPATVVWDFKTKMVVKVVKEVGGMDEVGYDSAANRYYTASRDQPGGAVLGVIDAKTDQWIENVPTAPGAHSVAADSKTQHVFVPLTANPNCPKSCIGVYGVK